MIHRSHWASFLRFLSGLTWMFIYYALNAMFWALDGQRLWMKFLHAFIRLFP